MKGLRNKVILSGIVLLFAFIATIGSTYAWFTVSTSTEVNSMEFNVGAADNLMIRPWESGVTYLNDGSGVEADLATASNYKTILTNQDLIDAGYLYDDPVLKTGAWRLQPTTVVVPGYTGLNYKQLNKISISDRVLTALSVEGTDFNSSSGYYIQLKFWLYSQAETAKNITVDNMLVTTVEGNTDIQDGIVGAVRMSLWLDDTQFGSSPVGSASVFGSNVNYDYAFSGDFANSTVGNTLDEVAVALSQPALNSTAEAAVNLLSATPTLFTIQPTTPTLVTVLVYVEGWNSAANNDVSEAGFKRIFRI